MPSCVVICTVILMNSSDRKEPEGCQNEIDSSEQNNFDTGEIVINSVVTKLSICLGVHHGIGDTNQSIAKRSELIEQVMRMTDDDRLVIPFLDASAGSTEILSATGRLLASPPSPFPLGSPLALWVEPSAKLKLHWRSLLQTCERSMWDELVFYRSIMKDVSCETVNEFCCPYEELEHLRLTASNSLYDNREN